LDSGLWFLEKSRSRIAFKHQQQWVDSKSSRFKSVGMIAMKNYDRHKE